MFGRQSLKIGMSPVYFSHTDALHSSSPLWAPRRPMAHTRRMRLRSAQQAPQPHHLPWCGLSRGHPGRRLSTSSTPRTSPWRKPLLQLSRRRPPCSTKKVAKSSLPRVLMVQSPFPIDNPPLCTIQVQQIVTSSGLNRWRSAGPMREVRRMARTSFWLAFSRWRGWQRPAEHPQQPRVCHIGHGFHPEQEERLVLIAPSARPRFGYPTSEYL